MEKKCDFSISAAKLLYQTVKTCQHLKKNAKKIKKMVALPQQCYHKKNGESPAPLKKNAHNEGSLWAEKN
jgi:hypothetical protein